LAQIAVVLGLLRAVWAVAAAGVPQIAESYRIAFADDPDIPAYSIRVMRDGTEAEIVGGFKYGLTDDFEKILNASRGCGSSISTASAAGSAKAKSCFVSSAPAD
jgi:hypothetical protein